MRKIAIDKVLVATVFEYLASIAGMVSAAAGAAFCLAEDPTKVSLSGTISMYGFAVGGVILVAAAYQMRKTA